MKAGPGKVKTRFKCGDVVLRIDTGRCGTCGDSIPSILSFGYCPTRMMLASFVSITRKGMKMKRYRRSCGMKSNSYPRKPR